jgi:hypothetical protein
MEIGVGSRGAQIGANVLLALGAASAYFAVIPTRVYLFLPRLYGLRMTEQVRHKAGKKLNRFRIALAVVSALAWSGFLIVWLVRPDIRICWSCNP